MNETNDYTYQVIERTKEARKSAGFKTQAGIALALGITRERYAKYETERIMHKELISVFCEKTGITEKWLLSGEDNADTSIGHVPLKGISVIGEVEAGIWREAVQWDEHEIFEIPYGVHEKYNNKAYGLRIRGDSMNLAYPEGTIVIVVSIWDYEGEIISGKRVIVERCKRDGICEATAKELEVIDGYAKLWPRSTNPKYQQPIDITWPYNTPQEIGLETVEIKGIIIGSYRSEE